MTGSSRASRMPIFEVGNLVVPRYIDDPDDWDAIGLIVGMRDTQLDVIFRVLWSDALEPRWASRQSIIPKRDTETDV